MIQRFLSKKRLDGKSYWIIGASSGIGYALAKEMNARGARVIISARRSHNLNDLAQQLNGQSLAIPMDVRDSDAVKHAFQAIVRNFKIDGVIYMAGIFTPMKLSNLDIDEVAMIIAANLTGAFRIVHAVLPYFLARKAGQIALCASVIGYRGLAHAQPYGATKAGLINFAESLRAECMKKNVDIKVINPGFIKTPMTDKNKFRMPALINADKAARIIADGLHTKSFEIHFPKRFTLLMKLLRFVPSGIYFKIMARCK